MPFPPESSSFSHGACRWISAKFRQVWSFQLFLDDSNRTWTRNETTISFLQVQCCADVSVVIWFTNMMKLFSLEEVDVRSHELHFSSSLVWIWMCPKLEEDGTIFLDYEPSIPWCGSGSYLKSRSCDLWCQSQDCIHELCATIQSNYIND